MQQTLRQEAPRKLFLRALSGEATADIPFWLMRQAGRYLPEYRALRQKAGSFLNLCFNPELAAEVTLQPLQRFGMDAAILFSDILVVPYALGQALNFAEGEGPRLGPFDQLDLTEVDLVAFDRKLQPVYDTVSAVSALLPKDKALVGFAGAPWTVACYMVQGRGGDFSAVKAYAFENPERFDRLIDTLTEVTAYYLCQQIRRGAEAVQIFDSWAGLLPEPYFLRWAEAPAKKIVAAVRQIYPGFPVTGFPREAGELYSRYARETGVTCIGVDQHYSLQKVVEGCEGTVTVQGNLDPQLLLQGGHALEQGVSAVLAAAGKAPFIFNLGHGVIKETPPEHVAQLTKLIREYNRS